MSLFGLLHTKLAPLLRSSVVRFLCVCVHASTVDLIVCVLPPWPSSRESLPKAHGSLYQRIGPGSCIYSDLNSLIGFPLPAFHLILMVNPLDIAYLSSVAAAALAYLAYKVADGQSTLPASRLTGSDLCTEDLNRYPVRPERIQF